MSTVYPGAIDTFTTWQDGVDTVAAAQVNNLQDSMDAVQTTLGVDPQGSYTTVGAGLADKVSKGGDTMSGDLDMDGNRVTGLAEPEDDNDAASRIFVEEAVSPSGIRWRDDFLGARSSRWTLGGMGGTYTQNAELGGTGDLATGATTSNQASLSFNGKGCTDVTKAPFLKTRAKLESLTQVRAVLAGLYGDSNNLIEIYYDVTSTAGNYKYRCVSGGTETSVDSGVAADTNYHDFEIEIEDGDAFFFIDEANEETVDTNIPTALLEPLILVETKENADKVLVVDLLELAAER